MGETLGSIIFSDHALERLNKRGITKSMVQLALAKPDKTYPGNDKTSVKFIKTIDRRRVHVIATHLADQNKWLIISVWVRGEDDRLPLAWQLMTLPFRATWLVTRVTTTWLWRYFRKKTTSN